MSEAQLCAICDSEDCRCFTAGGVALKGLPNVGAQRVVQRADSLEQSPATTGDARPEIEASIGDLREAAEAAQVALVAANQPPRYFTHGGLLARIELNDDGMPFTRALDADRLRHHLARAAHYVRRNKDGGLQDCRPPMDVVRDLLASPERMWPRLRRIVGTPILASDGSLCATVGYNPPSESWYHPNALRVPPFERPSDIDIAQSVDLLSEMIEDFPFTDDADRAHAFALMIQPFVREMIDGPTPMYLIEKPSPGTGATLLVTALLWPALGGPPASFTEAGSEDEWRKRITAALRAAPEALLVENLHAKVNSAALAAALTSREWGDRLLGVSEMVKLPIRCAWVATANNPELSTEMVRRSVRIRMDAGMERPWERGPATFRHPDLMQWVAEQRGELVAACLTLAAAWVEAGRPRGAAHLGMFESWASVMSGILEVAGVKGTLDNTSSFYEAMIIEDESLDELVELWWRDFSDRAVASADLFPLADESGVDLGTGSERSQRTAFGHILRGARDRRFGSRIIRSRGKKSGAARWALEVVGS